MKRIALWLVLAAIMASAVSFAGDLEERARAGEAEAQYRLGLAYLMGEGVPQDYARAAEWFEKAAEQGVADAQFQIGTLYAYGTGVPFSQAEAVHWWRQAAARGSLEAEALLNAGRTSGK